MIYFYAEQTGPAFHLRGLTRFRVPVLSDRGADGVLDGAVVSPGYFDAMGFGLSAGRVFDAEALRPGGCRVAVVNQPAAELYFGGRAVGAAVIDGRGRRTTIVGTVHSPLLRTSQRAVEPTIYFPMTQDVEPRMTLMLGAREVDDEMLGAVRRRLAVVDGGRDEAVVTTLDAHLSRTALAPERIATILMATSAATALTLGVLGMYGAMSDSVRRRRREFALRIALGAQSWRVMAQVLSEGLRLAGAGALAGLIVSLLIAQALARLSPAAGTLNLLASLAGLIVLVAAVAIASVVPTRRALSADPLSIMRDN
jgi:putative ABC transport system permease protein